MRSTSWLRVTCALLLGVIAHGFNASRVVAQAWVAGKGEGTVSITYQNYDVAGHYDAQGRKNNNGGTFSHAAIVEFDYGLTDTIGILVALPFISSKYTGPSVYFVGKIETHPGPLDDGTYHGAFQDLRIEGRRLFWAGPVPVAPFVGVSFPTHDYETQGEAVPGRGRWDLQVGASVGASLDRLLKGTYAHGRYAYARAEEVDDFPFTRSLLDVEVGVPLGSRVIARGIAAWQIRHKGPSVQELAADWEHHDRFIAPSFTNLGIGLSVPVKAAELYALWLGTVAGSNGAHRQRTLAAGVTFGFGGGLGGLGGGTPAVRDAQLPSRSGLSRR